MKTRSAIRFPELTKLLLASLLLTSGCAKVREIEYATAEGKVTLDGTPLQDGIVSFESSDTGFSAMSTLDGDGMFRIEKVPVGKYAVTISPPAPPDPGEKPAPRPIHYGPLRTPPAKYVSAATSGLEASVPAGGIKDLAFPLAK